MSLIISVKNTHLLDARRSDSVEVRLNSFEIFRMFRTQQFKSCLQQNEFMILMFS